MTTTLAGAENFFRKLNSCNVPNVMLCLDKNFIHYSSSKVVNYVNPKIKLSLQYQHLGL